MEKGLTLLIYLLLISLFSLADSHPFKEDPKCRDCHAALLEKQSIHAPAKNGCDMCHQINTTEHSQNKSKGLFLLKKLPELCYTCHAGTKKEIDTSRVVHHAVNEKKQCTNCHSPHSSNEKKLLTADKKELCLGCHDKEEVIFGKKITNIKQLLKTSKVIHPALNGGCTSCHKPHASAENYLLISAYPAGQYAEGKKDNYAVCWECHDSDLLELAKTSTATGFRDGERNLHFVHVNGKKGRSCSICHDVHATKREHLIVEKVPFGEWEMPLNYIPSESGGSCSPGCHQQYQYTR
ncbi:MAG: cytochrome c3 family protein [Bacteroidota bacterium]